MICGVKGLFSLVCFFLLLFVGRQGRMGLKVYFCAMWWATMLTMDLTVAKVPSLPYRTLQLKKNQTEVFDVISLNMTSLLVKTDVDWRVVLTFDYIPSTPRSRRLDCAYANDYLLVGNDFTAVGQESLTSYRFCHETLNSQVVSRGRYLWVVLKSSSAPPTIMNLRVQALPEEQCSENQTRCSPVHCINPSQVCDGREDCHGGLDEYCYHFDNAGNDLAVQPPDTSLDGEPNIEERRHLLPPEDSACFLCRDGTCILPRVPRYDGRWVTGLWYLCDGVSHCPDGWDEQTYMCYLVKHFPRQNNLFQCDGFDAPASSPRQVRMWSLARCDDRRDCRSDDEEGDDRCVKSKKEESPDVTRKLYMNHVALGVVITFCVVIVGSAVITDKIIQRNIREQLRFDNRAASDLQGCLAIKTTETDTDVVSDDLGVLRETVV